MKKIYFSAVAILLLFAGNALAQEIQYPVKELGDCQSKEECKNYCDREENSEACISFAEKNNLMSSEEAVLARKMISGETGPGGCKNKNSCEKYCDNIANIDECVSFAEQNGLMSPEELGEAKKVQQAIKRGVKPPPCKNKKSCDIYCENPENMEVCITFAKEAGFIEGKELEDAEKMLQAIKRGVKPPPCKGKEACDEYCNNPENMEVCMDFALEAGFIPEEEREGAEKMLQAIKRGVKPPPCRGKEECDEYCNKPENQETCFNFAKESGMIPEEDLKRMEEENQRFRDSLTQVPPQVLECLKSKIGAEKLQGLKSGSVNPSQEIGEAMKSCFEQMGPPSSPENRPGPSLQTGPGGCQSEEECRAYCQNNPAKCSGFGPRIPEGGMMPPEGGVMPPPEGFSPPEGYQPPAPREEFVPPTQIQPIEPIQAPMPELAPPPEPIPMPEPEPEPQASIFKSLLGSVKSIF